MSCHCFPADLLISAVPLAFMHTIMNRQEHLAQLTDMQQRWDGWLNLAKQVLVPNFTATGFKVMDAPKELHKALYDRLHEHLEGDWENTLSVEGSRPLEIMGPSQPFFYSNDKLNTRAMNELHAEHEAWAGVKLSKSMTYGVRKCVS
jgi:hypothetical protein